MSEPSDHLSPEQLEQINKIADRFESEVTDGSSPCIEDYLSEHPQLKSHLLRKLLTLEIQLLRQRGESPIKDAYLNRFPESQDFIDLLFGEAQDQRLADRTSAASPVGDETCLSCPHCSSLIDLGEGSVGAEIICQSCGGTLQSFGFGNVATPAQLEPTQFSPDSDGGNGLSTNQRSDGVSRYRATKLHARGGLGAVYRARDTELNRTVALKEILPDHSANEVLRERFAFEAQVTGSLEHPGIVPVYGFGRHRDDRPYYAMRFIRGESFQSVIQKFHESNSTLKATVFVGREFRTLLQRFVDACNAMQYAHEHGVLHRDIKPDNIMIGRYGETLVVDWGLAKLVDVESPGEATGLPSAIGASGSGSQTRQGSTVGTPLYMSPEQAAGQHDQLDARSDVYSLGAVLFKIISGQTPVSGKGTREIVLNVREGKVRDLSSLVPAVPRSLASIAHRALAHKPADRYATAIELAEDVERWMSDELVLAHAQHETLFERAGRLLRRYRGWTVSVAASLVVVTSIAVVAALMINNAKLEAVRAQKEALERYRDARGAIDTWLVQSSDVLKFFPETQELRKQLLQLAIDEYQDLAAKPTSNAELQLEQGRVLAKLGELNQLQREYRDAKENFETALEALQIESSDDTLARWGLSEQASVRTKLGLLYAEQGEFSNADDEIQQAIDQLTTLLNDEDDPLAREYLAAAYLHRGAIQERQQKLNLANENLQAGLDQYAVLSDPSDATKLSVARAHERHAKVLAQLGDYAEADQAFASAIEILQPLVDVQVDQPEFLEALAITRNTMASSYRDRGQEKDFIDAMKSSTDYLRDLHRARPNVPRYQESLGMALTNLGLALHESGRNPQAEPFLIEASRLLDELYVKYPHIPRCCENLAACQDAIGQVWLESAEDPVPAIEALLDAVRLFDSLTVQYPRTPVYRQRMAIALSHYSRALQRGGEDEDAKTGFGESVTILQQLLAESEQTSPGDPNRYLNPLANVHYFFAHLLNEQQDPEASRQFQAARDTWILIDENQTARDKHHLAWLLATCPIEEIRDLELAAKYSDQAVELAANNARYLTTSALCYILTDDIIEAMSRLDRIQAVGGERDGRFHFVLAMAQHLSGDLESAQQSMLAGNQWKDANQPFNEELGTLQEIAETWMSK